MPTDATAVQIAAVILVNRSGQILLQHRDEHTPNFPNLWCMPGGHVEPGEEIVDAAARELFEESALTADAVSLRHFASVPASAPSRVLHYFYGMTAGRQEDVVLGEGAAMVFTSPTEAFTGRVFVPTSAATLRRFLDSEEYAALVGC